MERMCLVLGAGASKPYGYPLGFELKQRIIQYCLSKPQDCAPPNELQDHQKILEDVAHRLDTSPAPTIDQFLDDFRGCIEHTQEWELGQHARMAVAAVLLRHEYRPAITNGWYNDLVRHLSMRDGLAPLRIITFNYDRSFEHFLSALLQGRVPVPANPVEEFRRNVELRHIYGGLAPLPGFGKGEQEFPYGKFTGHSAWKHGREIFKFVHDEADPASVADCRSVVHESDVVVTLGFGFDHLNLTRIGLHDGNENILIVSSAFKLDSATKQRVRWTCAPRRIHFGRQDAEIPAFLSETGILARIGKEETIDEIWTRLGSGS